MVVWGSGMEEKSLAVLPHQVDTMTNRQDKNGEPGVSIKWVMEPAFVPKPNFIGSIRKAMPAVQTLLLTKLNQPLSVFLPQLQREPQLQQEPPLPPNLPIPLPRPNQPPPHPMIKETTVLLFPGGGLPTILVPIV